MNSRLRDEGKKQTSKIALGDNLDSFHSYTSNSSFKCKAACYSISLVSMSRKGSRLLPGCLATGRFNCGVHSTMWTCPTWAQSVHLPSVLGYFLIHSQANCVPAQMIIAVFPLYTHNSAFLTANKLINLAGGVLPCFSLFFFFFKTLPRVWSIWGSPINLCF